MINQSQNLRVQFGQRRKAERDAAALTYDALKEGHAEGLARSLAEGQAEGFAEGRAEGFDEGHAEGFAEGYAEGFAEGLAQGIALGRQQGGRDAVLRVFIARGFSVSDEVRRRLADQTDLQVLQSWLARACVASRAEELLDS